MAVIFTEDWSSDDFTQWGEQTDPIPSSFSIRPGRGADGGNAFTCSYTNIAVETATLEKSLTDYTTPYTELSVRFQYALYAESIAPWALVGVNNFYTFSSSVDTQFTSLVLIDHVTGILTLFIDDGLLGPVDFASSYVVPRDGTWHGYQVTYAFSGDHMVAFTVTVDNALVLSGSFTPTTTTPPCMTPWGYFDPINAIPSCVTYVPSAGISNFRIGVGRLPAQCGPAEWVAAMSTVEVDSSASIVDWPACDAIPLDGSFCSPPCEVTGMECGPSDGQIRVTGTGFLDGLSIQLRDREDRDTTVTIDSLSDTELILDELDPAFRPGTYCITVTNPCT